MEDVSLGEYIRRLRRSVHLSLHSLAEKTNISYSHLSRIENDSTIPGAQTIAVIAETLDGDLKFMLEEAEALPRSILNRISSRGEGASAMRRAAHQSADDGYTEAEWDAATSQFVRALGLPEIDSNELGDLVRRFTRLNDQRRRAITSLIHSLAEEDDDHTR